MLLPNANRLQTNCHRKAKMETFPWMTILLLVTFSNVVCNAVGNPHENSIQANNNRPIIGIVSQEVTGGLAPASPESVSYIAASYVKWVEGQGARAVPIRINQPEDYYYDIFHSINGLLIPGGGASLETSGYSRAASLLYELALEANDDGDFFPIWGTCLGFELLLYLSAGKKNYLTPCDAYDRAFTLHFESEAAASKLFGSAPEDVLRTLSEESSTSNFHRWCMTRSNLSSSGLDSFYVPLASSNDDGQLEFIASFESKHYPIWGVQFHPEKNLYEWNERYSSVPHSPGAVLVGQYFAEFFINQARRNSHRFASVDEERASLIYNYPTVYTGNVSNSFLQCYFFN